MEGPGRIRPDGWNGTAFDNSHWASARVEAPVTGQPWNSAGGLMDWPGYNPDVPYLAHKTLPFVRVLALHPGAGRSPMPTL